MIAPLEAAGSDRGQSIHRLALADHRDEVFLICKTTERTWQAI